MPGSVSFGKQNVLEFLTENILYINRCLDIGTGTGIYSQLLRQSGNNCEIIGIEIFEPYISQFNLTEKYSQIINDDARLLDFDKLGKFDVVFAGDVLEHMYREEADTVIKKILAITHYFIISIPIIEIHQTEVNGNIYETHLVPDWTHDEFYEKYKDYIIDYIIPETASPEEPVGVYWLSQKQ
jgi:SAM-dependent methyltransferase